MRGLVDIFFPPTCVACARVLGHDAFFCEPCDEEVDRLPPDRCELCAEPGEFSARRCPRCLERPPPFASTYAPFAHEGAVARAIHQFKYEDHPELAGALAALLAEEARAHLVGAPRLVCAIPLHRSRLVERKYDQAELLARALSAKLGATCVDALVRTRQTTRQVGLTEQARDRNVEGAFTADERVRGQDVLLVDDVFTTGATARAAALAIKAAGGRDVHVLTLARAFTR